ncbi:chloramphenicol resistance protein [Apiospora arundinis]
MADSHNSPKAAAEDAFSDHSFSIDFYMRHLRDSKLFRNKRFFERFPLQQYSWTAPNCTHPFDVVEWMMYKDERNVTSEEEIIGLNLTFAMLIEDLTDRRDVYERVDQCAYITLVNSSDFNFTAAAGNRDTVNRQELANIEEADDLQDLDPNRGRSPPPRYPYPASEASGSTSFSTPHTRPAPPPFFDLYEYASAEDLADDHFESLPSNEKSPAPSTAHPASAAAPAYAPRATSSAVPPQDSTSSAPASAAYQDVVAETKRSLPPDNKPESSGQKSDDPNEPPPAYTEGYSPLLSFTYLMAAAGGASSIITQVQQGGPGPINTIGDVGADETITMDLRGTRFVLSRDELLTLPEFVLLSLFPNGLFPEGHMGGFAEGDAVQVDYDPASLQYMLDFFRNVAQSIPNESSPNASPDGGAMPIDSLGGSRDDGSKRAGIIVLREDLDFYAIPPRADINQAEMIEVKRAAARALLKQNGIFSGLKRSDEPGTTEAHLIEMLTAGGFDHDDRWGHRAGEPNKAVVCSLALARLRSDIRGNDMGNNAVGMAQKLLLFWRKPARRCWWEGVDLENVEGVDGPLKVWIRRVWTLEMSVIGLR